ncbi:MAG: CxxC-x17-CxxC domain-containing protein [Patescibacteria group bacterium]
MEEENKISTEGARRIPQPSDIVFFAKTNFRNQETKFGIKKDDRRRHMYLIGKTGMGKSTAMENMIIQDIHNGEGVCLVDPHGDFAEKILNFIPTSRINDVVYLNPADMEYPIAFNVMESVGVEQKHLVASGLIGVFKKLWADSWGPRLEYLLRNAILALLDYPGSTLLGVMRILVDKNYRQKVIEKIQDPVVKSFWVEEYSKYPQTFQVEAIAPIQNKVGQFLSNALIRNVVGQVKSTIDMRYIMDNRKILIMNLSKGRIGEDSSALLGAMMITKIQLAAMSRIDMPESERKDFYLYVDEFQNFATESFATILSEARKYRLDLIIGHQYVEQLDEIVRAAVFGNVGTLMCFRIGAADAEFLATEFAPYFIEEDLVNLAKYDTYMKLMIDGVSSNPFSAKTLPPLGDEYYTGSAEKVIRVSRERYAKPKSVVEDKIGRWTGMIVEAEEKQMAEFAKIKADQRQKGKRRNNTDTQNPANSQGQTPAKNTYTVDCYECGQPTEITFKPDGVRPVYCQSCFQKIREKLMHGQAKEIKMQEEVKNTVAPEISLAEALTKPPQSFDQRNSQPTRPSNRNNELPKKMTVQDLIQKKITEDKEQKKETNNAETRTLKPGQIIKF